jgi:predicted transcriptional regulator
MTTRQYKNLKGLKKESLRDNMSTTELVINMLAETAAREFSEAEKPEGFEQSVSVAKRGGKVAGDARRAIETGTGKPIITSKKATELNHVITEMIEASASAVEKSKSE